MVKLVVGKPIEQSGRHLGITEHTAPLAEAEIGGDVDNAIARAGRKHAWRVQ